MSQLAFWPLIDVRACVCVCGWVRVLMWIMNAVMTGLGWPKCHQVLQRINICTHTHTHRGNMFCFLVFYPSYYWTQNTCISVTHAPHTHNVCPQMSTNQSLFFTCFDFHMFFLSFLIFSSSSSAGLRCTCLSLLQPALFSLYHWPCYGCVSVCECM